MIPTIPEIQRIGIDTGGTFTDIAWTVNGCLHTAKVLSHPAAPADAVIAGLQKVSHVSGLLCHGTTVGTNAILARHGGPARMVVTTGFRDVLEIGRGERSDIYSIAPSRHIPLVSQDDILEINLRLDADGNFLVEPSTEEISSLADELIKSGAKSIGIGILHSASHPGSELNLSGKINYLTGIPTFPSAGLSAYPREYERWSLASMAAYLAPVLGSYLEELVDRCPLQLVLMASSGGLISTDHAVSNSATCVLSGPAGGTLAALSCGQENVLALDMGGTSTDVTLLSGNLPRTREASIDNIPLPLPAIDIHTIGAGGGSIVKFDTGGMLALGPESAGASPGPACYGNYGPATLSDAALLSGRLVPDMFLGGEMNLDPKAAEEALDSIRPHGMTLDHLLDGILELAEVHLTGALRKISVARGIDPSDPDKPFTLVPFGGAGALFAVDCARSLGLREVLHPHAAGVFSAIGLLQAPIVRECERAILRDVAESIHLISKTRSELIDEIKLFLDEWPQSGSAIFITTLECRYYGQTHTLEIPLPDNFDSENIKTAFESAYRARYTYIHPDSRVEIVTIRIRGEIPAPDLAFPEISNENRSLESAKIRSTNLRMDGQWVESPVYKRDTIPIDTPIDGPVLIVEDFATLYLPPDTQAQIDNHGHVLVEIS